MKMSEFHVGDLFEKIKTNKLPYKAADYKDESLENNVPATTSGLFNQGLTAFVPKDGATILKNCISIASNGDAGTAFYQPDEFTTLQDSYAIKYKKEVNISPKPEHYLYAVTLFMKGIKPLYSYVNKATWNKVKLNKILLPVKDVIVPDYTLIEKIVGGIDMSKIDTSNWREFKLGDLFDIENTWIYGKDKKYKTRLSTPNESSIAVISGTTANNGVNYYTNDTLDETEIYCDCLTMSTRGNSGKCFYHDESFCLANNVLVMPMPGLSKNIKLFFGTIISKLPYGDNYSNYPTKDSLKEDKILLPYKETEEIDFEYMENYISELEAERISELEAYLAVTGLDDYELTEEDVEVLNRYRIEVEVVA